MFSQRRRKKGHRNMMSGMTYTVKLRLVEIKMKS
jgi:hypothetical protein